MKGPVSRWSLCVCARERVNERVRVCEWVCTCEQVGGVRGCTYGYARV